ncbi:hypothetical protein [Paenibacillus lemnae]|uniref:hypothetical protein n=1 Tax=Paenibacillus lemnae TaxID=1330551 RepID=UPI001B7D688A|nr:hypothetical protein [Paenibacillus lemnae]
MGKDTVIRSLLSEQVSITPNGFVADLLTPEQFTAHHELFFDKLLEIHASDLAGLEGYGEFDEECKTGYKSCEDFLIHTFADDQEGYWYHWREMFDTTILEREFFEKYFNEMTARIPYCEGHRYLVNNNTFFEIMITDGRSTLGFPDWSRSGICDFLLDWNC